MTAPWDIFPLLVVITLVLGTTFSGIMTPTESASLGAFLTIILALLFRQMTYPAVKESMLSAVNMGAMIAFVFLTARMLGQVFQYIGLTKATATFMTHCSGLRKFLGFRMLPERGIFGVTLRYAEEIREGLRNNTERERLGRNTGINL